MLEFRYLKYVFDELDTDGAQFSGKVVNESKVGRYQLYLVSW